MDIPYTVTKTEYGFYVLMQRHVRCFFFEGKDFNILVDTCFGGDLLKIIGEISDKPVKVIFTHCDRDHIGGEDLFTEKYVYPSEYSCALEKNGVELDALPVWEGDVIDNGNFKLEVVHIPGHTPGSIALLERDKRFLIGGDSVQTGAIYMFGQGRSLKAYKASMKKLMALSDKFDVVYSSHNELEIKPEVIPELYDLADEIDRGIIPEPIPAPGQMPENVKIYGKKRANLFLYEIK